MQTDVTHQNGLNRQKLTNDSNPFLAHNAFIPTVPTLDGKAGRIRGVRLNGRGTVVLEEYVRLHPDDTNPMMMTQKSLLVQVQEAQGSSGIKLSSISYWFKRRRDKGQPPPPPRSPHPQKQRFKTPLTPTSPMTPFTEETLHKLHTLTQATPHPGPEVLDIWASLFHVSRPVLQYAIEFVLPSHFRTTTPQSSPNNSCQIESNPPSPTTYAPSPSRSRRLPTPPRSSTPELRFRGSESLKDEIHSPMIPNVIITGGPPPAFHHHHHQHHPNLSNGVFPSTSPLPAPVSVPTAMYKQPLSHLSPPQTPVTNDVSKTLAAGPPVGLLSGGLDPTPLHISTLKNAVLLGVTEACIGAAQSNHKDQPQPQPQPPLPLLPKTAAESDQRFAPYQAKLEHLSIFLDAVLKSSPPPPPHE